MTDYSSQNNTILQGFEWHTPSRSPEAHETHSPHSHYARLTRLLPSLAAVGITSLWIPPGCKGMNRDGNGYDIYDLWDLGEFERHGARSTKWGSREELNDLLNEAKRVGIDIVWDTVFSHRTGAEAPQETWAVEVDSGDRRIEICSPRKIEAWLRFDFPSREQAGMPYSQMRWHADHFNGADWDHRGQKKAIFKLISDPSSHPFQVVQKTPTPFSSRFSRLLPFRNRRRSNASAETQPQIPRQTLQPPKRPGKGWADDVDSEHGNNDFLMLANIDYSHPEVRQDVLNWGTWMINDIGVNGFRLDAVRHISFNFIRDWIKHVGAAGLNRNSKYPLVVGEVWTGELRRILKWLDAVQDPSGHPQVYAFDAPLLYNFSHLSEALVTQVMRRSLPLTSTQSLPTPRPDLRSLLEHTLLQTQPKAAVTLVTNHDTQPGQMSATPMDRRLKPLFYAFVLLRQEGLPCVFWGDLFGIRTPGNYEAPVGTSEGEAHPTTSGLVDLMACRKLFAYGSQTNYWESPSCIAWTRSGNNHFSGCAVVLSLQGTSAIRPGGDRHRLEHIKMEIGKPGEDWFDILNRVQSDVPIDVRGYGAFPVDGPGVSVFVSRTAPGVKQFPVRFDLDIYRDVA